MMRSFAGTSQRLTGYRSQWNEITHFSSRKTRRGGPLLGGGLGHLVMMKVVKLQPVILSLRRILLQIREGLIHCNPCAKKILRAAQNDRRVPVLGQRLLLCQYKAQNVEISKESKRRHSRKFEWRLFLLKSTERGKVYNENIWIYSSFRNGPE